MSSTPNSALDALAAPLLLGTDGASARDDVRDPATCDPAALSLRCDARADDAGGLSGGRAGHGGVGSALTKLTAAQRAALIELSKQRQYAHMQVVESLLCGTAMSIEEADREAYRRVPNDAAIPAGKHHGARAATAEPQPRL